MSFDLFVFERREEIKTSLDIFAYRRSLRRIKKRKIMTLWRGALMEWSIGRKKCLKNSRR